MLLKDLLAGLEVPPKIGVRDFGAKDAEQENGAHGRDGDLPWAGRFFGLGVIRSARIGGLR